MTEEPNVRQEEYKVSGAGLVDKIKELVHQGNIRRIVIKQDGEVVGDHERRFGRDQVTYDPWHYVAVLAKKPGALRNGAPFKDWMLPTALARVRGKLKSSEDGDRQMVTILTAVLTDGLPTVEAAYREALDAGIANADVILNILARRQQPEPTPSILTPQALALRRAPLANCARYDGLRTPAVEVLHGAPGDPGHDDGAQTARHACCL